MKRTVVRSLVKIPASVVIFCAGISLLLSGCGGRCGFVAGSGPSCSATVAEPGIYRVTYQDSTGAEQTREIAFTGMSGDAGVCIGDCTWIIGDPVLISPLPPDNSPPDCSQARASVPILPNDPARMVEESIEGVTDPDGNSIGIRIDTIEQDEPSVLFEGDLCPDGFTTSVSTARLRAERSAYENGRVYTIGFTASDRRGGICQGKAKATVPLMAEGTAVEEPVGYASNSCVPGFSPTDLSATVSATPDPVTVGNTLTYNITVHNNGPRIADRVRLTDTIVFAGEIGSISTTQGSCGPPGRDIKCELGTISNGANVVVSVIVTPTRPGTIYNNAHVDAAGPDLNPDDNGFSVDVTVEPAPIQPADLSVTISGSPDPIMVGDRLTYTTTLTNNGPGTASRATLSERSAFALRIVSVSPTQGGCSQLNEDVDCELGSVSSGSNVVVTIVADVLNITTGGTITSNVSVAAGEADPNPANNTAAVTTVVIYPADLVVTIIDTPDPVIRGGAVTYTTTVTNNGPIRATNVVLTDVLPPIEVSDSDILVSQGSFTRQRRAGTITCNFGALASGASATLTVTGFTATTGTITNSASATANEPDSNTANNSAAEDTTVTVSEEETLLASWLYQGQFSPVCRPLADRSARFEVPQDIPGRPWLLSWLSCSQRN